MDEWLCHKCHGRSPKATYRVHGCCGSCCDRVCTPCHCVTKPKCTCKRKLTSAEALAKFIKEVEAIPTPCKDIGTDCPHLRGVLDALEKYKEVRDA